MIPLANDPVDLDIPTIVANLAGRGLLTLRIPQNINNQIEVDLPTLLCALANSNEPRLREALIPLFLLHPEYAYEVPRIVAKLEPKAAQFLRHMYTAAVYLQRFWHTSLGIYLGTTVPLPDYFGQSFFHLPPASEHYGEAGLRSLADFFHQNTGYDWLTVYESSITLLLQQLSLQRFSHVN